MFLCIRHKWQQQRAERRRGGGGGRPEVLVCLSLSLFLAYCLFSKWHPPPFLSPPPSVGTGGGGGGRGGGRGRAGGGGGGGGGILCVFTKLFISEMI